MLNVVLILVAIGILLWLINQYIPMDGKIKMIVNVFVVVCVVMWLLHIFGILDLLNVPVPNLRRHR